MGNTKLIRNVFILALMAVIPARSFSATGAKKIMVGVGQSELLEVSATVKRISIANPEVADASVTSPKQILINGKALGTTSMIVWDETEQYRIFKLIVHTEVSNHQVSLRVRFAEANRTALKEMGMNFLVKQGIGKDRLSAGSFGGKAGTPADPFLLPFDNVPEQSRGDLRESVLNDNIDFFLSIPTRNIAAVVKALEERNLLTTLAKPNLSAISGSEASFLAGGEIPVPIVSGATGQVTILFKEFGIRLKFVPTVLDSNLVNIKVATEVSSLDFDNGIILSGFRIPALISRKAETTVELKDGEHFIVGGLIANDVAKTSSKVPGLGHLPILGNLFSSSRFLNNETELIIMISPHIIQTMQDDAVPELH